MGLKILTIALCLLTSPLFALDFGDIPADTNVTTLWVAPARTLTIGGTTFDLSANRTWTTSTLLDQLGSTQGMILYRGASNWTVLSPGTDGRVLTTHGAGSNPTWSSLPTPTATPTATPSNTPTPTPTPTATPTATAAAPADAHYLTDRAEAGLSNEVNLGALSSGIVTQTVAGSVATMVIVTAPAGAVVGTTDTQTLTNKRINPRITSISSNATWAPGADTDDVYEITAQAAAVTTISNPSGTPVDGQKLIIRATCDGTNRALTFSGSQWRASSDLSLPTTLLANKTTYMGFMFNSLATKWDMIAKLENF